MRDCTRITVLFDISFLLFLNAPARTQVQIYPGCHKGKRRATNTFDNRSLVFYAKKETKQLKYLSQPFGFPITLM
jgi:hypothetical protein